MFCIGTVRLLSCFVQDDCDFCITAYTPPPHPTLFVHSGYSALLCRVACTSECLLGSEITRLSTPAWRSLHFRSKLSFIMFEDVGGTWACRETQSLCWESFLINLPHHSLRKAESLNQTQSSWYSLVIQSLPSKARIAGSRHFCRFWVSGL